MRNKPRIHLIHSPEVYYEQNYGVQFAPVWAYTLSAYISNNHWDVQIFDLTQESIDNVTGAEIFAFSGINQDFNAIRKNHDILKERFPKATFILGGPITWSYQQSGKIEELNYFDHLFILDGEQTLPQFLENFESNRPSEKYIQSKHRFPLGSAHSMRFDLLKSVADRYYGAVLEVSRGCPFLCEFCDIRVLPQNNESHTKDPKLVVAELEQYYDLGIRQVQLACDNFIGDLQWANNCVDAIMEWTERTGKKMALYTWLTINIAGQANLLAKMRKAGFTAFFIGVETFNANSVLETSKVQNKNEKNQMEAALQTIHSYGFIVVPGLIFGFDSDSSEMFDIMANGIQNAGLIGGDPTFLLALPGTPLYKRMKAAGRLAEFKEEDANLKLEKARISKVEANITYIQPKDFLIHGFMHFIKKFTSGSFNYNRFKKHVDLVMNSDHLIVSHNIGYGNVFKFLSFQLSSFKNVRRFLLRNLLLLKPQNLFAILKGYFLVLRHRKRYPGIKNHFFFWVFLWSNLILKYRNLKQEDFKIKSIDEDFNLENVWSYAENSVEKTETLVGGKNKDGIKVQLQFKSTQGALRLLKENSQKPEYSKEAFEFELRKYRKVA